MMSRATVLRLLLALNVGLAGALGFRAHHLRSGSSPSEGMVASTESTPSAAPRGGPEVSTSNAATGASGAGSSNAAPTVFSMVYTSDARTFVANLRAIKCPEETIKDILTAEIHRRHKEQEQALGATPADHVPWMWSAQTTEPRLVERREQAAELARTEGGMLREALGCVPSVPMPLYAMTSSDQQFEDRLASSPQLDACSIRQVHDTYWSDVKALLERTKGFWLPDDVAQLELLKQRRRVALSGLMPQP